MLLVFPFLAWLAAGTSAVLLVSLWTSGDVGMPAAIVLCGWLLVAVYFQFFGSSAIVGAIGVALQTILAIYLIVRWRLSAWPWHRDRL